METTDSNDQDLGNTKWNNLQKKTHQNEEFNEGFSTKNIPDDYNPSDERIENRLKTEFEIDEQGNETEVRRARSVDQNSPQGAQIQDTDADNTIIENRESLKNRDRNSDIQPNRYPTSHPENYQNRGNIQTDSEEF